MTKFFLIISVLIMGCGASDNGSGDKDLDFRLMSMQEQGRIDSTLMAKAIWQAPEVTRIRALQTIGIVRDKRFTDDLLRICESEDILLRPASIFSLGEIRDSSTVSSSLSLCASPDLDTRLLAIEAIGKIGNMPAEDDFPVLDNETNFDKIAKAFAYWRLKRLDRVDSLRSWASSPDPKLEYAAVYSMFRLAPDSGNQQFLSVFNRPSDDETKSIAIRGLAAAGDSAALISIFDSYYQTLGKSSRVELVRGMGGLKIGVDKLEKLSDVTDDNGIMREILLALGSIGRSRSAELLESFLDSPSLQVRLAAISSLSRISRVNSLKVLSKYIDDPLWQIRSEVAGAMGEIGSRAAEKKLKQMLSDNDERVKSSVIQAFGNFPINRNLDLIRAALLGSKDFVVRSVAADILGSSQNDKAFELLTEAAARTDSSDNIDYHRSLVGALANYIDSSNTGDMAIAAITTFLDHPERIVRQDAFEALGSFGPSEFDPGVFDIEFEEKDFEFIEEVRSERPVALIKTAHGNLRVELDPVSAPRTVANFVKLANRKFYDGLTFHRVVQNFVVQGGCPRGDGWGGPEYFIREEINPIKFETGTIGMATSGRDTGGSQFFICLSAQPHLDGRYTAFGRLIDGWDALYNIEIGDIIYSVTIEKGN